VSRLAGELLAPDVKEAAAALRESLAVYKQNEDLITLGAYQLGTDARVDAAIELQPAATRFLRQGIDEPVPAAESDRALVGLMTPAADVVLA
jgi:flagellum-specific ATP synthase